MGDGHQRDTGVRDRKPCLVLSLSVTRIMFFSGARVVGHQGPVSLLCPFRRPPGSCVPRVPVFHVCVGLGFTRLLASSSPYGDQFVGCSCEDSNPIRTSRQRVSVLSSSLRVGLGIPESPSVTQENRRPNNQQTRVVGSAPGLAGGIMVRG